MLLLLPDVTPTQIIVATEFVSSGEDRYEIYAIDDLHAPLRTSTAFTMRARSARHESMRKNVDLVENLNEHGMATKLTHRTFITPNETVKQQYELPVNFGNVLSLHLAYVHTNTNYDLVDVVMQNVQVLFCA